ncbi:MAG TPA: sulfurtransferase/chromate resistance protein [Sphingomonas sp.]|nr:sulfurtransferase/chromate resistance protein [Sphingomonas sp.]
MPAIGAIKADKLSRLIGTPGAPVLVDLRDAGDLIPGSVRRCAERVEQWAGALAGRPVIAICADGGASAAVAAWLRHAGAGAEILEGGVRAWSAAGLPLVREAVLPPRDEAGRTRWITRARPKVDRIACPWLIRRFVDPGAAILFAAPNDVVAAGERLDAAPFDVEGVFWSHRGELCTFDTMVEELGLAGWPGLDRLSAIVRGADTARPEIAPQAAGLLAASLGLSRMYADDHAQLEAGMTLYDAFYRWCRDATAETHNWPTNKVKA